MINTESYYAATDYYNSSVQQKQQKEAQEVNGKRAEAGGASGSSGQSRLSDKAQALLEKLRKTYNDMDFMVADFKNAKEAKAALSRGTKEVSVLFSKEELEKMAADEKCEKEYMDRVQKALQMSDEINRKYGYESAFGKKGGNGEITRIGIAFNEDGTTSFFAELEKSSASQRERIEKSREEKRTQRKEDAKKTEKERADAGMKRTTVQADSVEELLEKIRKVDWDNIRAANDPEEGRKFDFSI